MCEHDRARGYEICHRLPQGEPQDREGRGTYRGAVGSPGGHMHVVASAAAAGGNLILLYYANTKSKGDGTQRRVLDAAMSEARRQGRPGSKSGRTWTITRAAPAGRIRKTYA